MTVVTILFEKKTQTNKQTNKQKENQFTVPDNISPGGEHRFALVLDAMFLAQGLHKWCHLVIMVSGHCRK